MVILLRLNTFSSGVLLLFLLLTGRGTLYAQLKYQVYAESGYFNAKESGEAIDSKLLTRLSGELKYEYTGKGSAASLWMNVRPEFYGSQNPQNIIKAKTGANYFCRKEKFGYGIDLTGQRNSYNNPGNDFRFDMLFLTGQSEWYYINEVPLLINAGYAWQQAVDDNKQSYNIFFADVKAYQSLSQDMRISYGIYFENFNINNDIDLLHKFGFNTKNTGFRWGPQAGISYLEDFIFDADFNFLFHNSEYTRSPSYEQLFRMLAGSIFLDNFSAFILVDYYRRQLNLNDKFIDGVSPLYVPLNMENRVYLKLGYDLSEITELYIKTGYLRENLYDNKYTFSGWHVLAGIQISN
jgi:hypothetical protein